MKVIIVFILISFTFLACSHTKTLQDFQTEQEYYDRINRECEDESVIIITCEGDSLSGKFMNITEETLNMLLPNKSYKEITTNKIHKIIYNSESSGMMKGIGFGAAAGLITLLVVSDGSGHAGYLLFLPSILEVIVGGTIGAIVGDKREFLIYTSDKN